MELLGSILINMGKGCFFIMALYNIGGMVKAHKENRDRDHDPFLDAGTKLLYKADQIKDMIYYSMYAIISMLIVIW